MNFVEIQKKQPTSVLPHYRTQAVRTKFCSYRILLQVACIHPEIAEGISYKASSLIHVGVEANTNTWYVNTSLFAS